MVENRYELTTPAAQLVEVARIAAPYKNRPEMLMNVVIEVQKVVPALSEAVAAVIAREMGIAQTHVFYYILCYAVRKTAWQIYCKNVQKRSMSCTRRTRNCFGFGRPIEH